MAYLKVYEWEHTTWPDFQMVKIDRTRQYALNKKLARHFKVDEPRLVGSHQRGANAMNRASGASGKYHYAFPGMAVIKLGTISTLGTLCHEFAHHLNYRRWKAKGHGRTFKRELKRVYTFAKRYLKIDPSLN